MQASNTCPAPPALTPALVWLDKCDLRLPPRRALDVQVLTYTHFVCTLYCPLSALSLQQGGRSQCRAAGIRTREEQRLLRTPSSRKRSIYLEGTDRVVVATTAAEQIDRSLDFDIAQPNSQIEPRTVHVRHPQPPAQPRGRSVRRRAYHVLPCRRTQAQPFSYGLHCAVARCPSGAKLTRTSPAALSVDYWTAPESLGTRSWYDCCPFLRAAASLTLAVRGASLICNCAPTHRQSWVVARMHSERRPAKREQPSTHSCTCDISDQASRVLSGLTLDGQARLGRHGLAK